MIRSAQVPYAQMVVITGSEPHARKPAHRTPVESQIEVQIEADYRQKELIGESVELEHGTSRIF